MDNNPKVPSRIKAIIEGQGEDPGPCMADMGKRLEAFGADFLAIACNTAHFYYDAVNEAVDIPVINLIDIVSTYVKEAYPDQSSIGILASPAVAMTGLYTRKFEKLDILDVWPDPEYQASLLEVIKSVKGGDTGAVVQESYENVCRHLLSKGAETAIIACTELSALNSELPIHTVDASQVLAREIVRLAKLENS